MKNKKIWAAGMLLIAVVCFLCACQPRNQQKETDEETVLPVLKIGVDTLNPFYFTDENGDDAGIDADIAVEACRRAGYQPVFVKIDWNKRDTYLQDGTVDCIWTAFIKNGREDLYQWTDSYLQSNLRVITDKKSPDKKMEATLEHGSVAVRAGSKAEEIFLTRKTGEVSPRIYSCGTFEMAETAFVKGYAGSLCCHEEVLERVMHTYPDLYRFLDGVILKADLGVAFSKEDTSDRCEKINRALNTMKEDGTIAQIAFRYHRLDESEKKEVSADE